MAGVWVLWLNVNWVVRAQALLLGALVIRCNLKPAEVQLALPMLVVLPTAPHVSNCIARLSFAGRSPWCRA